MYSINGIFIDNMDNKPEIEKFSTIQPPPIHYPNLPPAPLFIVPFDQYYEVTDLNNLKSMQLNYYKLIKEKEKDSRAKRKEKVTKQIKLEQDQLQQNIYIDSVLYTKHYNNNIYNKPKPIEFDYESKRCPYD